MTGSSGIRRGAEWAALLGGLALLAAISCANMAGGNLMEGAEGLTITALAGAVVFLVQMNVRQLQVNRALATRVARAPGSETEGVVNGRRGT